MAQQQIITKPYVEELQDNDSLFINHDGALRQIKKSGADFASGAEMRAEVAAREAFEAQEVAAREAFEKSETEARGQFETSVGEQIAEKANVDGYYEEMTVGDAEQLISTQFVEDNEPYLFRPTGGSSDVGNREYIDAIVGGTVAWNQQVDTSTALLTTRAGVTLSRKENGKLFLSGTATGGVAWCIVGSVNLFVGHKYLSKRVAENVPIRVDDTETGNPAIVFSENLEVKTLTKPASNVVYAPVIEGKYVNSEINPFIIDLTQMFGSDIADYIYSLEQSQAGAGVAWFKKLFPKDYYEYNAGELLSVEGLESHDTVGFNQWDEEWEVGAISGGSPGNFSSSIRSKNFCDCLPSTAYYGKCGDYTNSYYMAIWWYDENKQYISNSWICGTAVTSPGNARYFKLSTNVSTYVYGGTYKNDICVNLSDPSRNGEYEPYEKHSYPLDSSLTLRGIPKLDASNNLYYDGDEYTSDGRVKRKYGIVDLGTLHWVHENNSFRTTGLYGIVKNYEPSQVPNILTAKYTTVSYSTDWTDGMISFTYGSGTRKLVIYDSEYTDSATFKAAMSGVMLVYELATPTAETAEPYNEIQICDDFGTEEFVSTSIVPVGHKTRYPANLRDKLQHLPDLASMDGTYLVKQTGKQMSLVHTPAVFPETPTEDGTYTLKTVVTGGVATLQWVAE